jgi:multidrug resistance efflux pump
MEQPKESIFKKPWVQSLSGIIIVLLLAVGALVYKSISSRVRIENSVISAPVINIGPETAGILDEVDVRAGDIVTAGQTLARVGADILTAKVDGIVIMVANTPGQVFMPTTPVIQMIDPAELRIVGTIKENEGLTDITVGDPVSFTVDAFGGTKFAGIIDSVSPNSKENGVAFSISDKREVKEFEVKAKFDVAAHPEFKNGMSAKMNVYTK